MKENQNVSIEEKKIQLKKEITKLKLEEVALKTIINTFYGAFGNKYFYFHNKDIAQSITIQGQDLIQFTGLSINYYFNKIWHVDKKLHEKLGVGDKKINNVTSEAWEYTDTDSCYINLQLAIDSIESFNPNKHEAVEFCYKIIDYKLSDFLNKAFDAYSEKYNTKNQQNFSFENISESAIWVAKKNYLLRVMFEDGSIIEPYIIPKGIDMAKSSFPKYARDKMEELSNIILDNGYGVNIEKDLIPKLEECKKAFILLNMDDVCMNFNIRVFDKYVTDDKELILEKGIPIRSRASAYHNHLIETLNNKKYRKIREGDKVKYYHSNDDKYPDFGVFAYSPNEYPHEFAPKIDYDEQFFRVVIEPINKMLNAMSMHQIDKYLKREFDFIKPRIKKEISNDEYYPLFAVNSETLEHKEIPAEFQDLIRNKKAEIPKDKFDEYISIITTYGLKTKIIPKIELPKYIKREETKKMKLDHIDYLSDINKDKLENFNNAVSKLKEYKYKYSFEEKTLNPTITKFKKPLTITKDEIEKFISLTEILKFVVNYFKKEELEAREKKEEKN